MWKKFKKRNLRSKEQGFTLVEILVAVALLSVISVAVTATIISVTSTTQKFTASATTQNEAADAISAITRDISASTDITAADDFSLSLTTSENNQKFNIIIFYWNPAESTVAPTGIATTNLPDSGSIIEFRKVDGAAMSTGTTKVLTTGYEKNRQDTVLFTYYDKDNVSIVTPIVGASTLDLIKRVEYKFALKVKNRPALIQLASSAIPRSATTIAQGGTMGVSTTCDTPIFVASITPKTTVANLSWNSVPNVTGYTLYRMNSKQVYNPMVVETINNFTTTTYADTTVTKGEKYRYYIISNCAIGTGDPTPPFPVNTTTDTPVIVNMNLTKNTTDTLASATEAGTSNASAASVGYNYTVARNLTNRITWLPVNGAESYKLYENGILVDTIIAPLTTATIATSYGDSNSYVVVATIAVVNGSGGDSSQSNTATLISPPAASTVRATPSDASTDSTKASNDLSVTSRASNTDGYVVRRHTTLAATPTCASATADTRLNFTSNTVSDTVAFGAVLWGSTTCYVVTGYNEAGSGPSATTTANQLPGKFSINYLREDDTRARMNTYYDLDENVDGLAGGRFDTNYTFGWSSSANSVDYDLRKQRTFSGSRVVDGADWTQTVNNATTSKQLLNITPGSTYKFSTTASSANGATRTATLDGNIRPAIPKEAHSIIMGGGGENYKRKLAVYRAASVGSANHVYGKAWFNNVGEPGYSGATVNETSYVDILSPAHVNGGDTGARTYAQVNIAGWVTNSRVVAWSGFVANGCSSTCGVTVWTDSAERSPDYYSGHHAYYLGF